MGVVVAGLDLRVGTGLAVGGLDDVVDAFHTPQGSYVPARREERGPQGIPTIQ
jgi:hypothetical protein